MYEAITIVKLRKAQTITVPAGGWVVLCVPEQPLHEHIARVNPLVREGNINEDYERLLIGRIQDSRTPVRFVTAAQAKANAERHEETERSFTDSHKDALKRQKAQAAAQETKAAEDHAERVALLNQEHDALRGRDAAPAVAGPAEAGPKTDAEELAGKTEVELRKVVADLNADPKRKTKITVDDKATKDQIVAGILEATKVDGEKQPGFIARLFGAK